MISACIITRNEADALKGCIEALKRYDVEIVVVDTGSIDHTAMVTDGYDEIKVFNYEWCDDFSAARNFAASKASNDIIFMVDTDELVEDIDIESIERKMKINPYLAGKVMRTSAAVRGGEPIFVTDYPGRIYNRKYCHFDGKVFEKIVPVPGVANIDRFDTFVAKAGLMHCIFTGDGAKSLGQKAVRNLDIFGRAGIKKNDSSWALYMQGKALYYAGKYSEAADAFERAMGGEHDSSLDYAVELIAGYGHSLLLCGRHEKAMELESLWPNLGRSSDFAFVMGLIYKANALNDAAISAFERALTLPAGLMNGVNSFLPNYMIGVIHEEQGFLDDAKIDYETCGDYEKAVKALERLG